jgi:hypothetical protein
MLHWIIESRPAAASAGPEIEIDGCRVATLDVPPETRGQPLAVTFDEIAERLKSSKGVYWEPDGSFAWTDPGPPRSRLQGQLSDGGAHLQHVELWGTPSLQMFNRMLHVTRGSGALMFQLVRSGIYVDEAALRQLCEIPTEQ